MTDFKKDSVEKIISDYRRFVATIPEKVFKKKGFTSETLASLKEKHNRVTIRILIMGLSSGDYNVLKDYLSRIEKELLPRIEAEKVRFNSKDYKKLKLDANLKIIPIDRLLDHLKDRELSDEISAVGEVLLQKRFRDFGLPGLFHSQKLQYDERGQWIGERGWVHTGILSCLEGYIEYLKFVLQEMNKVLDSELDITQRLNAIKGDISTQFRAYLLQSLDFTNYRSFKGAVGIVSSSLSRARTSLSKDLEGYKNYLDAPEREISSQKPKQPLLLKTKKYKKRIEDWEHGMGGEREDFEQMVLRYLNKYFMLHEIDRQWAEVKAYLSELLGKNNPLSQIE